MIDDRLLVRVSFRKQVSDGNYGTEAVEVTLEDHAISPLEQHAMCADLTETARTFVHAELGKSPSRVVRQSVGPPRKPDALGPSADPEDLPF